MPERIEQSTFHYVHLKISLCFAYPICMCIDCLILLTMMEMMMMVELALEVVVRVNCLIVAAFVDDADIVVDESKRVVEDMDYDVDDDGVGNDD